jgi:hypothetical protein
VLKLGYEGFPDRGIHPLLLLVIGQDFMAVLYDYVVLAAAPAGGKIPVLKMRRGGFPMEFLKAVMPAEKVIAAIDDTHDDLSQAEAADAGWIAFAMVKTTKPSKPATTTKVPCPLAQFASAVGRNSPLIGDVIAGRTVKGTKPAGAPRLR